MNPTLAGILLLGLALGVFYKTYASFAKKLDQGTITDFDPKYIGTAITAFIGSVLTAMTMFPEAAAAWAEGWPFGTGYLAVLGSGFLWSMSWNYGTNRILMDGRYGKVGGKFKEGP